LLIIFFILFSEFEVHDNNFVVAHHDAVRSAGSEFPFFLPDDVALVEVLKQLGAVHVLVVHSKDGLDEISLAAPTTVAELKDGEITEWTLTPDDVGIPSQTLTGLVVNSSEESLKLIKDALSRDKSDIGEKAANMIALNAGAGIYVAGITKTYKQAVEFAQDQMREIGVGPNKIHGLSRARAAPPRPADDWLRFCSGGSASGRLQLDETREGALCGHQLVVGADFDDAAVLHHDDAVRVGDGREPVSDDD
jgi:hypothetical protein